MTSDLKSAADTILDRMVSDEPRVPGVAAIATDRQDNIYEGAVGERVLGESVSMTTDTVCAVFSTTKALAGTVLLQLFEEGALDLDAPAKRYVPELGQVQVLEGFDERREPLLRPPKRDITTRMLMLHTAGFGYDFFNEKYHRLSVEHNQPSMFTCRKEAMRTPLLFEPGTQWEYGSNMDWAGQVVEAITGKRLSEAMRERILDPLEMHDTAFTLTPAMRQRLARIHQREHDDSLKLSDFALPEEPEVDMAGHGLYSTAQDYVKFIRMWLNDGRGPNGPVLSQETVQMAVQNGLGDLKIHMMPGVIPSLSNDAEFFPGMPKSWALTFMINNEDAPTGRPAGALGWAGLANLFYWIDRQNSVGGFWATQIFPFADPTSVGGYLDFETAVYESLS